MEGEHGKENSRQSEQQVQRQTQDFLMLGNNGGSKYGDLETEVSSFKMDFWLKKFCKLESWFKNGMGIRTRQTDLHFNPVCT